MAPTAAPRHGRTAAALHPARARTRLVVQEAFVTPATLVIVAAIVAGVWAALLGTAYAVRLADFGRGASLAASAPAT